MLAKDRFEVDLSSFSSFGVYRSTRAGITGILLLIPVLVVLVLGARFVADGIGSVSLLEAAILGPVGGFFLAGAWYSYFVTRAPGATNLRVDPLGITLEFPAGRPEVYRWRDPSFDVSLAFYDRTFGPDGALLTSIGGRAWRPTTFLPRSSAEMLLEVARAVGTVAITSESVPTRNGSKTVYRIRSPFPESD